MSLSPDGARSASAWIGLGANLGDRRATLDSATEHMARCGAVVRASSYYETSPVGVLDQPLFLNAIVHLRTELSPRALLEALLEIEQVHGRQRGTEAVRFGPRTLDLDLLFYDDRVIDEVGLEVPHPRLHERRFVLEPLCEIAPDLEHPSLCVVMSVLLEQLEQS